MIRLWSLRRFDGFHWAKAIRDMRSPPNVACGLRLDTEAITSPEASSRSVVTTLVVPTSTAMPKAMAVVSPRSTVSGPPWNVTTVTSALASRSVVGSVRITSRGTSAGSRCRPPARAARGRMSGGAPPGAGRRAPGASGSRSPSRRAPATTASFSTPRIWKARSSSGGAICATSGSVTDSWQDSRYPSRTRSSTELKLVVDRAGRRGAPDDLHPTGGAASAPAAGRGDVDALGVGRAEEDAAGIDHDGPAVGQDRHGDGWHADILDDRARR